MHFTVYDVLYLQFSRVGEKKCILLVIYILREHIFKILHTTNTICGENCESPWVQVSL